MDSESIWFIVSDASNLINNRIRKCHSELFKFVSIEVLVADDVSGGFPNALLFNGFQ